MYKFHHRSAVFPATKIPLFLMKSSESLSGRTSHSFQLKIFGKKNFNCTTENVKGYNTFMIAESPQEQINSFYVISNSHLPPPPRLTSQQPRWQPLPSTRKTLLASFSPSSGAGSRQDGWVRRSRPHQSPKAAPEGIVCVFVRWLVHLLLVITSVSIHVCTNNFIIIRTKMSNYKS